MKNGKPFKTLDEVSEKLKQDRRGLYAEYFAFQRDPLTELEDEKAVALADRDANLIRIDNQVFFPDNAAFSDMPFNLGNFAAVWDGFFVVPEQGEYWLFLGADNAARVDIDGETVLLNDVKSRYIEVSTVLDLAPGLHPIHIEFAQGILANEDSWRCACSFMWLPKGQQKPVAVPPEMLMVPEWMWSDDAPIITKLSKYEGEIGDEIEIHGQGLAPTEAIMLGGVDELQLSATPVHVEIGGQPAHIIIETYSALRVRVPMGACSGKLIVFRGGRGAAGSGLEEVSFGRAVPSNSVDFKVTTQFGLLAEWRSMEGMSTFTFEQAEERIPSVQRVEQVFSGEGSSWKIESPFGDVPCACHWTGNLLVPGQFTSQGRTLLTPGAYYGDGTPIPQHLLELKLRLEFNGGRCRWRVTLGGNAVEAEPWLQDRNPMPGLAIAECILRGSGERRLRIDIELLVFGHEPQPNILATWVGSPTNNTGDGVALDWDPGARVYAANRYFVPLVTPPQPPRIASVTPIPLTADEALPPFPSGELPSLREGQQCRIEVVISTSLFASKELDDAPITLMIDGHFIDAGTGSLWDEKGIKTKSFTVTIPPGCGEGKLTAKLGLSVSEPFYVDIANKGLIAYLYDLPNPSGYEQFPDVGPLTCHSIRKDRDLNFETADSFKLPFIAETFAVEWFGAVIVEKEGWYTFTTLSDDGVRVWLNGQEIIDDDNLHAPHEKSSERIKLVPGTYPFRMQFFENNQHEVCTLSWQADDLMENEIIPKQIVPRKAFTWEVHDQLPNKVATGKRADGSDGQ